MDRTGEWGAGRAARGALLSGGGERAFAWTFLVLATMWAFVVLVVPDRTFADDSYFYLMVAWHMARGMGSTFNTLMPTNGYHPLWMLLCTLVFKVIPKRAEAVHGVAALLVVLDGLMLVTVARLLRKVGGHLWPVAFALLVPFCFGSQLGTEGALSGLFLALLMMTAWKFAGQPTQRTALMLNSVMAMTVLSRLDNIFVVGMVSLAVWLLPGPGARERRRLQTVWAAVPVVLWAGYVGSNWVWFHTIQPISGVLKSSMGRRDHALGANLPHTAVLALAVIAPCLAVVAGRRRDLFFRVVELPFAGGVLLHALYIVFVMSSETRWTWYYTSWMLLAAVLLARVCAIGLEQRPGLVLPVCGVAAAMVLAGWWTTSYGKFWRGRDYRPPASFNAELYGRLGVRRAIAYDEPGVFAFYSDIDIVPMDGLMGDLAFQHELATQGIEEFVRRERIDAWIGPNSPLDAVTGHKACDQIFLSSEQFRCVRTADGQYRVVGVDVYARLPPKLAGTLPLPASAQIYEIPGSITVWRLQR